MASDSISLGEMEVSDKILRKQLQKTENDIIAFQKKIDKILKWKLTIDDSGLRRAIGRAMNEFTRFESQATRAANNIAGALTKAIPNIGEVAARQAQAVKSLYDGILNQAKQVGATRLGDTAKTRAASPGGMGGGSSDLLAAQNRLLQAQSAARAAQEAKDRSLILAAEKQLSQAKIALLRQEIAEVRKLEAERLNLVKGEANQEIKIRTDAARQIAAKERQIQNETKRGQGLGKRNIRSGAEFGENVSTIMQGLQSGNITGIAAAAFGPMGAAAGAAFDIIKSGYEAVIDASKQFNDQIRISESLLVGNASSIADLSEAHQDLRFSARETGVSLNETQTVFNQMLGSVPALGDDMAALASLTDKVNKAAVGMGGSATDVAAGMTNLANAMGLSLTEEENQVFILDRLSRLTI